MDNFKISRIIRKVLTSYFQIKAKLIGQRFYCGVLSGESDYNLVINSDMTVSCNCQDYVGTGHIGDLKENDLIGIYNGPVAREFRTKLAKGVLPILTCSRCSDLRWIKKKDALRFRARLDIPTSIMVENTIHCNLSCVGCQRVWCK